MKKLAAALGFLVGLSIALPTFAQSTINPTLPAFGLPYNPQPIQQNFQAAANDINGLFSLHAGASPPQNPVLGELWLNTPQSSRIYPLETWDGSAWLIVGAFDTVNHIWMPPIGGGVLPNVLSATTTDLGSVPQASLTVTGNNGIQSFGSTAPAGTLKVVLFSGSPMLVGSSSLLIPGGGTSIQQLPGDIAIALATGNGIWQVLFDSRLLQSCSANGNFSCTNIVSETGPYTVLSTDCSNIIQLAGNAYYTVTVGAVGSYPVNCQLTLDNIDTGRAKQILVSGSGQEIIFPGQQLIITAGGGAWNFPRQPRWRIPANTTFYVDPVNGQDLPGEDCLAPTMGACRSIQGAVDLVTRHVDFNNFTVSIQLAPDTTPGDYKRFAINGILVGVTQGDVGTPSGQPAGNLIITGATTAATNYLIDGQGANSCVKVSLGASVLLQNLTLQNCNRLINEFGQATAVFINNIAVGDCSVGPSTPAQFFVGRLGYMEAIGPYQIIGSANCANHTDLLAEGVFWADATNTGPILATITSNLTYTNAFVRPFLQSTMNFRNYTASPYSLGGNTVTATPFVIQGSSSIELGSSGDPAAFFPGNSSGETFDFSTLNAREHNSPPSIVSCGGGSPSIVTRATDYSGVVTEGTAVTACLLNFSGAFAQNPICSLTPVGTNPIPANLNYTVTHGVPSTLTISHDSASGAGIAYRCTGG